MQALLLLVGISFGTGELTGSDFMVPHLALRAEPAVYVEESHVVRVVIQLPLVSRVHGCIPPQPPSPLKP